MIKDRVLIENQINNLLHERLFFAIRKIIIQNQKDRFIKTKEYADSRNKSSELEKQYKNWFESVSTFYLSYHSIYALRPLVKREIKIREFSSEEVFRIKADYSYSDIEFSAYYPNHYNNTMIKEMEDCIEEIKSAKTHIVDKFIQKKDTERSPHPPLTTAEIKYSAFYLFGFEPNYTTHLLNNLYSVGLITNPVTSGWNIEEEIVEDIITILHQIYPSNKILQYKRVYADKTGNRLDQECIRPLYVSSQYFPKNIEKNKEFNSINFKNIDDKNNSKRLYEFIFYITLSTQMTNSVYDTSSIEIVAKNKTLKEQANVLIDGEENWELLTGGILKKLAQYDESSKKQTVVLPDVPQETILTPLDVYAYSYQSKRPPRYGIGRFVTQILEKNNIGTSSHHDKIIEELLNSKAIYQVKNMIHPQENAIILIEWLEKHLNPLVDLEYLSELNEKIDMAVGGEIEVITILDEINRLIDAAFESSGFAEDISDSKIKLIKSIALKHNLKLDDSVYKNNAKADIFLAQYPTAEPTKVGRCPSCNSLVLQKEYINKSGETLYYFSCENFSRNQNGCNFSLWDSYLYKFFSNKSIEMYTVDERRETLKKILSKKKGYLFHGFVAKNKKTYDAKVFLEEYSDKENNKRWQLSLKFENKEKR